MNDDTAPKDQPLIKLETVRPRNKIVHVESTILKRQDITEDLWLIWIEKPEGFTFKAGQYCTIGHDGVERAYSIVSAPNEEELELFIELVPLPDGVLTPKLWELGVGDTVTIRPRAKGRFVFKPSLPNQLLVATVTGVVPYVSFVRDYLHAGLEGHHFYIIEGASYRDELVYDTELEALSAEHPELITFLPTLSRPTEERNAGWTGETGRANEIVEDWIAQWGLSTDDTIVYACGHPGMIEEVKAKLLPRGFALEEERFWKQD
jgi:ferredoxin--NADP+ reductase